MLKLGWMLLSFCHINRFGTMAPPGFVLLSSLMNVELVAQVRIAATNALTSLQELARPDIPARVGFDTVQKVEPEFPSAHTKITRYWFVHDGSP